MLVAKRGRIAERCVRENRGAREGQARLIARLPDLSEARSDEQGGREDALSELRQPRYAGEGLAADRRIHPRSAAAALCLACNFRFTTFERVQLRELAVIKRNGRRVPFDRDKLVALGADRAAQAATVEPERIEQHGVEDRARTRKPGRERGLLRDDRRDGDGAPARARRCRLVRFASVYRNFREAKDFEDRAGRTLRRRGREGAAAKIALQAVAWMPQIESAEIKAQDELFHVAQR